MSPTDRHTPAASRGTVLRLVSAAPESAPAEPLPKPPAPSFCSHELAAEMGELFAMTLLRDIPFERLTDPHAVIRIGPGTRITLHELLCELRSLAWCDATATCLPAEGSAPHSWAGQGDPGHRRAARWNGDGQLTLPSLFCHGVAKAGRSVGASGLFAGADRPVEPAGAVPIPAETEALAHWIRWCARTSGARLPVPGADGPPPATPADLARVVGAAPPSRVIQSAVLSALSDGLRLNPRLRAASPGWTASRLFHLMARAERNARRVALARAASADRLSRPAVTAARMSVHLEREGCAAGQEACVMRDAADELATAAPGLLRWMTLANAPVRPTRLTENLFLPILEADQLPPHPADLAPVVMIAGALATLVKAAFDTACRPALPGRGMPNPGLGAEMDRIAANTAMARCVLATHYPAENHQDLRIGETIALQLLRAALETDNCSTSLEFTDFDGRTMRISAHPRSFGRGHAELWRDGEPVVWPQDAERPAAHLTAVI